METIITEENRITPFTRLQAFAELRLSRALGNTITEVHCSDGNTIRVIHTETGFPLDIIGPQGQQDSWTTDDIVHILDEKGRLKLRIHLDQIPGNLLPGYTLQI